MHFNNIIIHKFAFGIIFCRVVAPLTEEQKEELTIEAKVLSQWPAIKRKFYRANQELVRKFYCVFNQAYSQEVI